MSNYSVFNDNNGTYGLDLWGTVYPSRIEFSEATESVANSGIFGTYTIQATITSNQFIPTSYRNTCPNDGKHRSIQARMLPILSGAFSASVYVPPVSVLPWQAYTTGAVAIPSSSILSITSSFASTATSASYASSSATAFSATQVPAAGILGTVANATSASYAATASAAAPTFVIGTDPGGTSLLRVGGDVIIKSLGTFDSTGTRFGGTSGPPQAYDVLSYDPSANNKIRSRLIQMSFGNAALATDIANDGTFVGSAHISEIFTGSIPGGQPYPAPIVTPGYQCNIVSMSVSLPVGCYFIVDWSVNGGPFTSGGDFNTGNASVHSNISANNSYVYKYAVHGSTQSAYSATSSAATPLLQSEVNPFALITAAQITTGYLSAVSQNVGVITAGQILNHSKNVCLQLDTTFPIPNTVTQGIFFASANPVTSSVSGAYLDFTATGTNLWMKSPNSALTIDASGKLITSGTISTQLGTSGIFAICGGRFSTQGDVFLGNPAAGTASLHSVTIPANALTVDGQSITFEALAQSVVAGGSNNGLSWACSFAGTTLVIQAMSSAGTTNSHLFRIVLTKVGAKVYWQGYMDGAALWSAPHAALNTFAVTWTNSNTFTTSTYVTGAPINCSFEEFYLTGFGVQ